MNDYGQAVRRLLRQAGWKRVRQGGKGSHEIWAGADGAGRKVSVPVTIKSRYTANAILKQAGISRRF